MSIDDTADARGDVDSVLAGIGALFGVTWPLGVPVETVLDDLVAVRGEAQARIEAAHRAAFAAEERVKVAVDLAERAAVLAASAGRRAADQLYEGAALGRGEVIEVLGRLLDEAADYTDTAGAYHYVQGAIQALAADHDVRGGGL